ncbi:hypothetical protein [Natronolimnohabitans innermongolicus]|uniref:Uncharacterized protein n=1 Tax=Natronolimnohabitans innermongolicus JCM 12255 TaxID=1227499 RepID=L9WIL5_9EURY|nr:hypothetical protein [Natronolimnohabitans innermongolicus]ELY49294.1 hypothetical protein C493_20526 [Natronolimnohabitans innermongolicus JCM 12255]
MGLIERFEDEYVDVSSTRTTLRELLELFVGAVVFVLLASGLTYYVAGETAALVVVAVLSSIFAITLVSQAYWAVTGRDDYR